MRQSDHSSESPRPDRTLKQLFFAARKISDPQHRSRWLEDACCGDSELQRRVEALFEPLPRSVGPGQTAAGAEDPNATPASDVHVESPPNPKHDHEPSSSAGRDRIGPYRLIRKLGVGGMSVVYLGQRDTPEAGLVAVKVFALPDSSPGNAQRFLREQAILTRLSHPNIASLVDCGRLESGERYYVMEYFPGVSITEFSESHRASHRDRVRFMIAVCDTITYAHQQGILHRDLKPSNILVSGQPASFKLKVIDFGIAKDIASDLRAASLTRSLQILGTPLYMSPEHLRPTDHRIDVRSDVFSLGCVLYELLWGKAPYDTPRSRSFGLLEIQRQLLSEDPVPIHPLPAGGIDRDLQWIVMKSLEKARERRYKSPSALADDLKRHLDQIPVLAGPPSGLDVLKKWAAKNRWTATTAAFTVACLLLSTGFSIRQAAVAYRAQVEAIEQFNRADAMREEAERQARLARASERSALEARDRTELALLAAETEKTRAEREVYFSEMRLASDSAWEGDLALAKRVLNRHDPRANPRNWVGPEWHLLNGAIHREPLLRHDCGSPIIAVALSPDAKWLLVALDNFEVRLFEPSSFQLLRTIPTTACQLGIAWHPDSRRFALGGEDAYVRIFGLEGSDDDPSPRVHEVVSFVAHDDEVNSLVFSSDGQFLVTASDDHTICSWDTSTWEPRLRRNAHRRSVEQVVLAEDNSILASAGSDGWFKTWRFPGLTEIDAWFLEHARVQTVSLGRAGEWVVAGDVAGNLLFGDLVKPNRHAKVRSLDGVERVQVLTDNTTIAASDRGGRVHLLKIDTEGPSVTIVGSYLERWQVSETRVSTFCMLSDGILIAGDRAGVLSQWSTRQPFVVDVASNCQASCKLSDDAVLLVSEGRPSVFEPSSRQVKPWNIVPPFPVALVSYSQKSQRIAIYGDQTLAVWDTNSGQPLASWTPGNDGRHLDLSADGRRVLIQQDMGSHILTSCYEISKRDAITTIMTEGVSRAKFLAPERIGVVHLGTLQILPLGDSRPSLVLSGHDTTLSDFLELDDERIATVSHDRSLGVWDARSGELLARQEIEVFPGLSLALSPDGGRIAVGTAGGTVKLFDTSTLPFREVLRLPAAGGAQSVYFLDRGRRLLIHALDKRVVSYGDS